jgi:hypothetical protein
MHLDKIWNVASVTLVLVQSTFSLTLGTTGDPSDELCPLPKGR